jgi:hypothetical protein
MGSPANAIIARFEPMRSLANGSLTGTFVMVGTPFEHPSRFFKIFNSTNVEIDISTDGIEVHDSLPPSVGEIYDTSSNRNEIGGTLAFPAGTRIYVRITAGGGTPSLGRVTLTTIFGSDA